MGETAAAALGGVVEMILDRRRGAPLYGIRTTLQDTCADDPIQYPLS